MELRIFLLADFANISAGKLNVIGAFNLIWAHQFPAVHPSMYLVAKLAAGYGEFGVERDFKILQHDEDGNELGKIEGRFTFPKPKTGERSEHTIIVGLRDLKFEKPSRYQFRILVNDILMGDIPLDVVQQNNLPQDT